MWAGTVCFPLLPSYCEIPRRHLAPEKQLKDAENKPNIVLASGRAKPCGARRLRRESARTALIGARRHRGPAQGAQPSSLAVMASSRNGLKAAFQRSAFSARA